MLQLETRKLEGTEIELCRQVSTDTRFKSFRDVLSNDLSYLRELSDQETGRESELMSKGARQYIIRLLEITDAERASEVFKKYKDNI